MASFDSERYRIDCEESQDGDYFILYDKKADKIIAEGWDLERIIEIANHGHI